MRAAALAKAKKAANPNGAKKAKEDLKKAESKSLNSNTSADGASIKAEEAAERALAAVQSATKAEVRKATQMSTKLFEAKANYRIARQRYLGALPAAEKARVEAKEKKDAAASKQAVIDARKKKVATMKAAAEKAARLKAEKVAKATNAAEAKLAAITKAKAAETAALTAKAKAAAKVPPAPVKKPVVPAPKKQDKAKEVAAVKQSIANIFKGTASPTA